MRAPRARRRWPGLVPVPATPLLGREQEAAAVEELVVREGVRLVTLTGPGGVGKSRLAVEAARRLGPGFADGVRFVELASVSAADLVAAAVAAGLGLTTSAGQLIADLQCYLRARRLLLVLDNFEQVVGAAPLLAELLAAAPGLVVLVTSRVVLRLRGEHEFPVPPLPVPPAGSSPDPAELQRLRLGGPVRRAGARRGPGLRADRRQRGGGGGDLPPAGRAAAGHRAGRGPGPAAAAAGAARRGSASRFSLLTGGARDLPERQRTLRNTLDWSFGLLSASEQALFARLGVFAGRVRPASGRSRRGADSPDPGQARSRGR